ncbi:MAG: family 20 glycosylhydrolase [Ignavibacteriaceae bacterium]|nr:family 20 glycosylhydrolase [Ignavibacteriaceae bacterium]
MGGDENNGKHWSANESIQKFMKEKNLPDNHALQAYFNNRILKILTRHGKKMIGWDEILHPQMPTNIVIHSWRGKDAMVKAAQEGYQSILSNGYYIDLIQPADFHYLNDPLPFDTPLSLSEQILILGGEATMWSELVTDENIDSRIWPRTAAIAERFWSSREINDVEKMYERLGRISIQLEELGLTHNKNYEMMLRRLANYNDINPLKTLVDLLEPVKGYKRHSQGVKYTSYSPYTRVVDAARPDAGEAREFRKMVDQLIVTGDKDIERVIKDKLKTWYDNHNKLVQLINKSPVLKEIEPLSEHLKEISVIGLNTIESLNRNQKVEPDKMVEYLKTIEMAKNPYGQLELMIVSAIEKLVLKMNQMK